MKEAILLTDGYKLAHHKMYPEGIELVYSNWTPRSNRYFPEAEKLLVKARAEAEANSLRTQALTPEILQKMWIEKWNGDVPAVVTNGNQMMLDISKFK